jgi:hypothetical protein
VFGVSYFPDVWHNKVNRMTEILQNNKNVKTKIPQLNILSPKSYTIV